MLIGIGLYGMIINAVPVLANTEVEKYTNTDFAMDTVVSETFVYNRRRSEYNDR